MIIAALLLLNLAIILYARRRYDGALKAVGERGASEKKAQEPACNPDGIGRELQKRSETEAAIRAGIEAGELVPYFEQQIDLASGSLRGFEMLARWHHPTRGLVAPGEFIPVAEECGLIGELSLSVMRQALIEARAWDNSLTVSVNISPIQLEDPWLAQKLAKLLSETGFPAERLEVEITERSLLENLGLVQAIVISLTNQGIRLALDDFGTGYSSLAHLQALPFDRIKIDRSFVTSINDRPQSAAIVTSITRLAESLNLPVTAEGVEGELIDARLRSIGSYTGQGWFFGKPMPVEDVRALLAGRGLLPARRSALTSPAGTRAPLRDERAA
jgi:EAL domain-containing protein (putative c-di-GMP-specific phosphodiesterase class I)